MEEKKTKEPNLSIVIPTHNKLDDLTKCIESILSIPFSHGIYEIVVVDDGSIIPVEPNLKLVDNKNINIKHVRLEGQGPASARNSGIIACDSEIIAFCDDDAIPQANYLDEIYKPFINSDNIVGVEGAVVPIEGETYGPLGMSPDNRSGKVYLTCNIAYRKSTLYKVGGMDESFRFPAFEDCDLAAAIECEGLIKWAPKAIVHHPRRCWSLSRAIREIKFNEPLILFARRYGYLGWPNRKTNIPWLKVYFASVFTLPIGRSIKALRNIRLYNLISSSQYIAISLTQGAIASVKVIPAIIRGYRLSSKRGKFI